MSKMDKFFIASLNKITKNDEDKIDLIMTYLNRFENKRTKCHKISVMKRLAKEYDVLSNKDNYDLITNAELFKEVNDYRDKLLPETKTISEFHVNFLLTKKCLINSPYDLMLYLLFVSGRRLCELFIEDNFYIENDELKIKKLLKKRDIVQDAGYTIELLDCNPEQFLRMYQEFIKMITKKDGTLLKNNTLQKIAGIILKSDMQDDSFRIKDLRPLFVSAQLKYNPKFKRMNVCLATKMLLHHENFNSVPNYLSKYEIV